MNRLMLALIAALIAFAGFSGHAAWHVKNGLFSKLLHEKPEIEKVHKTLAASTGKCGVERWAVKTLIDPSAAKVDLTPQSSTIPALASLAVPSGMSQDAKRLPGELSTFVLTGVTLVAAKLEADSDYHLVLQDSTGATMIAEIPDPSCAAGSTVLAQLAASRAAFDKAYPAVAGGGFVDIGKTVTVTGVAFFDVLHGQRGVAPNGIELHPVLSITSGSAPPPPAPPVTTGTTPTTTSTTPTATDRDRIADAKEHAHPRASDSDRADDKRER